MPFECDRPITGYDDLSADELAILAGLEPAIDKNDPPTVLKRLCAIHVGCKNNTDPQRRWANKVEQAIRMAEDTLANMTKVAHQPESQLLRHLLAIKRYWLAKGYESIERGLQRHQRIKEELDETVELRRADGRKVYADKILVSERRSVRSYKKRSECTAEEWLDHQRKQWKLKKKRLRDREKLLRMKA